MNIVDIPVLYLGMGLVVWLLASILLLMRNQYAGAAILAVFFFMPAMINLIFQGKHIPTGQLLLLFFGPILLLMYGIRRLPMVPSHLLFVFLYIIAVIITIYWNGLPFWSFKSALLPMIFAIMLYFAIVDLRSMRFLIGVFLAFVVISTTVAGLQYAGLSQFYLRSQEIEMEAGAFGAFVRGVGLAEHFSQTGLYCAAALPLSFMGFVGSNRKIKRLIWAVPGLFALAGITFTTLRAALIGGVAGVLVVLWFWDKRKLIPYMAVSFMMAFLLVVAVPVLRTSTMALVEHSTTLDGSAMSRPVLAARAIDLWTQSPVFGKGPRAFSRTTGHVGDAHNTYLNTLVEYGILGFVLFISILVVAFRSTSRAIKYNKELRTTAIGIFGALTAACLAAIVHSFNYISMFWLFPALGLSVGKLYKLSKVKGPS